ncbi:MAG: FecR domain-containing protein [Gammaproteobacteria bacterium]|jgi:hypothetical protein
MTHNNNATQQRLQKHITTLLAAALLVLLHAAAVANDWIYTVRPGDTLWTLSETHLSSMKYLDALQRHNTIADPQQITPGTRLKFPVAWLKHQPATAAVVSLQGEASLVSALDGSTRPLTVNTPLHTGDRIETGPDSNLSIRFADGSELLVLSDSRVEMDSLSAYGTTGMVDTRIRLQGGRVDTRVKPGQGPGSRYNIITPAAVAAVRGTQFRVSAETDRPVARSEVIEGKVSVSGAGASQLVPSGFGIIAEAGQPPQPPRKLLAAPDLSTLPALLDRTPLQFQWAPVENAAAYRFQVAASSQFERLLADSTTAQAATTMDLPDGDYVLRIRAIDKDRLEGLDAMHAFTVADRPQPTVLVDPTADPLQINEYEMAFHWQAVGGAARYHYQLASDPDFADIVSEGTVTTPHAVIPRPATGQYYFHAQIVDVHTTTWPYSMTYSISVPPVYYRPFLFVFIPQLL